MKSLVSQFVAICLTTATQAGAPFASAQAIEDGITRSATSVANVTFDFIICGGGLTGLTVASRLTKDPNISVLVIEAGEDHHEDNRVSDVRTYGEAFGSELDHGIYSTPVPWQHNRRELLVAGKMLGGSGSLNGATWTKGARSQYDLLPLLTGDDSWGWESFNDYMLKAEHFNPPSQDQQEHKGANYNAVHHGTGGPVQVSFGAGMFGDIQRPALEAAQKVWSGLERRSDLTAGIANGASITPNMVYQDQAQNRSSPFTAYAQHQVQERENFQILTGHRVTEIIWKEGPDMVADGVHFQASQDSPVLTVQARREVILAAGSLQSPQILELSGVGDPDVLTAAGIKPKHALLGVGKHMQEQTKSTLTFAAKSEISFNGTGPPSAIAFVTAAQLLRNEAEALYDDVDTTLQTYTAFLERSSLIANASATVNLLAAQLATLFEAPDSSAAEVFVTIDPKAHTVGADIWNLIVLSRGTAHITSASPWDHPTVSPNYFLHPLDLEFQSRAAQQARDVFNTFPLNDFIAQELSPPPTTDWVKQTFTSVWHYLGTLAMMKEEMGGVVDSTLKVYGVGNVRVVDASVLPIQLSAHLSSTLYGVAEKAAEMIREDWKGDNHEGDGRSVMRNVR